MALLGPMEKDHHTGLVFDDQEYGQLPPGQQKMIFDCRRGTTVGMRYINGGKPALPAIFTCNVLSRCVDLVVEGGAMATRTVVWEIPDDEIMYEI